MRYWVYINDKVDGPFDEDKLVTLQGFTQDTLICSEDTANSGNQEWVKASSIFEFDQPAVEPATAATQNMAAVSSAAPDQTSNDLAAVLLAKLDALTSQITGLQTKLDDMQSKLDDAITSQKQTPTATTMTPSMPPMDDSHANTITLTRHDIEAQVEQALPPQQEQQEKPLDMLGPVDLGENTSPDDDFSSKAGEDAVVSAALDSLYNARLAQEANDANENTFQDLLTPTQVAKLSETADAALAAQEEQARTLDEALKQVEQDAKDPETKKKLIDSFSTAPQQDVVDQIIQEKEEENKEDSGAGIALAAGAAVAAGAAALSSLGDDENKKEEITSNIEEAPELSISTQEPAPVPAEPTPSVQENSAPAFVENNSVLPSLDSSDQPAVVTQEEPNTQSALEELVPGAKVEQNDGVLITEQDLKDAFAEHKVEEQSVEQLFGLTGSANTQAQEETDSPQEAPKMENLEVLPSVEAQEASPEEPAAVSNAPANPNELTEIQLKEGSTYLISDFVPPAHTNGNAIPKELAGLEANNPTPNDPSATPDGKEEEEVQEMVSLKGQVEKPAQASADVPSDVTVSQVILENTIRSKRGASLDIKTVPMVPEPGESQRLHLEGMDDDLNTQHDLQEADVKPASKTTKVIALSLIGLLLLAAAYVGLAFLHLLPDQFNILSSKKEAVQQDQLEEMLGTQETDATTPVTVEEVTPIEVESANPMDTILDEVKNYTLPNGYTLKDFIETKHPATKDLITWEIATAVDPDNYSILVKVPPENPQSFKISYRFNYNAVTKELEPTISDAKNLLDSANTGANFATTPVEIQ